MSNTDDRNNKSNATAPRGRRDGRAPRARSRGRGFHFKLNAQMALTQHMMRRGRGLQPAATDVISLAIGNYHVASLNARKIEKNVYSTAADRNHIVETDPSTSTILRPAKTYRALSPSPLCLWNIARSSSRTSTSHVYTRLRTPTSTHTRSTCTYLTTSTTRPLSSRFSPTNSPKCSLLGSPRPRKAWTPYRYMKTRHTRYAHS